MSCYFYLTCLTLITSFVISSVQQPLPSYAKSLVTLANNYQRKKLPNTSKNNMFITVKLIPYEILAGNPMSYADVSLTISNTSKKDLQFEVSRIEILTSSQRRLLISNTPNDLGATKRIYLKPKESKIIEYRLASSSQIYERGQEVIAQIYYQQGSQSIQLIHSKSESVAFLIP